MKPINRSKSFHFSVCLYYYFLTVTQYLDEIQIFEAEMTGFQKLIVKKCERKMKS